MLPRSGTKPLCGMPWCSASSPRRPAPHVEPGEVWIHYITPFVHCTAIYMILTASAHVGFLGGVNTSTSSYPGGHEKACARTRLARGVKPLRIARA